MIQMLDHDQPDPVRTALARCYQLARERARIIREQEQAQRDGSLLPEEPSRRADAEPDKQQPDSHM